MKRLFLIPLMMTLTAAHVSFANETPATEPAEKVYPVSLDVSKRTPVQLGSINELRTYASTNNYFFEVNLKEGMRVLYSASYGVGGEAGQAAGTVVRKNGRFWFKQSSNPTGQLLLPPGLPINSGKEHSLWDLGSYLELVNRVALNDRNATSKSNNEVYGKPEAALVDFKGGTAGKFVTYQDALEVTFKKKVSTASNSDLRVYYARGIGPVALEFRENLSPAGTFKFYMGE